MSQQKTIQVVGEGSEPDRGVVSDTVTWEADQMRPKRTGSPAKEAGKEQRPSGQALRTRKAAAALLEPAPLPGTEQMSRVWQRFYKVVSQSLEK